MSGLPLKGIRVVDATVLMAGPLSTSYLARMGAEVIKVETRGHLDFNRKFGPFYGGKEATERGALYLGENVSKRSCTLDITTAKGAELLKQLVKISHVMLESFTTGTIEKWGLSYEVLRQVNPGLIMVSVSGFGRTGPEKHYVAYGRNLQAAAGLTALVGYVGGPPRGISGVWSDALSAMTLAFATLAALHHQSKTGKGQWLDLAMVEATAVQHCEPLMDYVMNHRNSPRMANRSHFAAPHNVYRCPGHDKWVAIEVSTDEEWRAFCRAIGSPEWTKREEFSNGLGRWQNQEELDRLVASWTINHTAKEVMEVLQASGVAAGVSMDAESLANDRHMAERGCFPQVEHPEIGKYSVMGLPWKLSDSDEARRHAPLLGQDNEYVFHQLLGLSRDDIDRLTREKVI